ADLAGFRRGHRAAAVRYVVGPNGLAVAAVACPRDQQRDALGAGTCVDAGHLLRLGHRVWLLRGRPHVRRLLERVLLDQLSVGAVGEEAAGELVCRSWELGQEVAT